MLNIVGWISVGLCVIAALALPVLYLRSLGHLGGTRQPARAGGQVRPWRLLPLWLLVAYQTVVLAVRMSGGPYTPWWVLPGQFFVLGMVIWSQVEGFVDAASVARREREERERRSEGYRRDLARRRGVPVSEAEPPAA